MLAIKTPTAYLVLLCAGAAGWALRRRRHEFDTAMCLWVPSAVLLLLMRANINIGVRHALPVVPFLAVLGGRVLGGWMDGRRKPKSDAALPWPQVAAAGTAAAMVASPLPSFPDLLGDFNALVGRAAGHRISMVGEDWGQDVIDLAAFTAKARLPLYYERYGITDHFEMSYQGARFYPIDCRVMPSQRAWIALHAARVVRGQADCHRWLERSKPTHAIHDHIWIYRFPPAGKVWRVDRAAP